MTDQEYYKSPIGRIMGMGVHDSVGPLALVGNYIKLIRKQFEKENPDLEEIKLYLARMEPQTRRVNDAVDYMYNKVKELTINNDKQTSEGSTSESNQ